MLTIIAHMVFWPVAVWNVFFWIIAFGRLMEGNPTPRYIKLRNMRDSIVSLTLLLVPGVYLFGIY